MEPMQFSSSEECGAEAILSFALAVVWKAIADGEALVHWFAVTGGWPPAPQPGARYWIRSTSLGYMAFEYVALDPPRRLVTRGLYTGRAFMWDLTEAREGTRLRITVRRGPDDRKWDADLEDNSAGYAALFVDLQRWLEGRYDAQRFPFFGLRTWPARPVRATRRWSPTCGPGRRRRGSGWETRSWRWTENRFLPVPCRSPRSIPWCPDTRRAAG